MHSLPSNFALYSFDVFDTLLVRSHLKPEEVFCEVEKKMIAKGANFWGFAKLRKQAEFEARKEKQFLSEVTMRQIYCHPDLVDQFTRDALTQAREIERALELADLQPIHMMRRVLWLLRLRGKRIAFSSDIYLDEQDIHHLLEKHGFWEEGDILLVSSSMGKMKSTGDLFDELINQASLPAKQICHIGDNFKSDVEMADSRGLGTSYFTGSQENRYEICDSCDVDIVRRSFGVSRCTRLANPYSDEHSSVVWETSCNVSGPLVFSFANWCIQNALRSGIKRLYFFARDGQILFKIAQEIVYRHYRDEIEVKYLHVSRQALLPASLKTIGPTDLSWILARTQILTPSIALKRINFSTSEVENALDELGLEADTMIDDQNFGLLCSLIEKIKPYILDRAEESRRLALGYFKQNGLFERDHLGVVDVGWGGTLQIALNKILAEEKGAPDITGFYFGLTRPVETKNSGQFQTWFTHYLQPRDLVNKAYIVPMIELFTAADHGGVDGYMQSEGGYSPKLRSFENEKALDWGLLVQQRAVMEYASRMTEALSAEQLRGFSDSLLPKVEQNLETFLTNPTAKEAQVYSQYEDAEDQAEAYYNRLGGALSFEEIKSVVNGRVARHHNEWVAGCLKLSEPNIVSMVKRTLKGTQ